MPKLRLNLKFKKQKPLLRIQIAKIFGPGRKADSKYSYRHTNQCPAKTIASLSYLESLFIQQ